MSIEHKTIILHCKTLADRKPHMVSQMEKHGFSNYCFFEDYDANELTEDVITQSCIRMKDDIDAIKKKTAIYEKIIPNVWRSLKELNRGELSLAIKYGKLFQQISAFDDEFFILLEDDVVLCEDFQYHFTHFLNNTPSDWDAIYFGSGANLVPPHTSKEKTAYLMDHPASRCTDSMVFKNKTIHDLAKTWFPFNLAADWEISYQHYLHNHKVYWWYPSLTQQGSQTGMYVSSLK